MGRQAVFNFSVGELRNEVVGELRKKVVGELMNEGFTPFGWDDLS